MRMRIQASTALSLLLGSVPAHALWTLSPVPGTEGKIYSGFAYDPATGDFIVVAENKILRFDPAAGTSREIPVFRPGLDGFRLTWVGVSPTGAIDYQWTKYAESKGFGGSQIFRSDGGQGIVWIAGRPDTLLFKGDSPNATAKGVGCMADSVAYGPEGRIFATSGLNGRVFMIYPSWRPGTRSTPEKDVFGIQALAGFRRDVSEELSADEIAAALAKGGADARKVPLSPDGIALNAQGDILFTDRACNKVFRLVPPSQAHGFWALETKADLENPMAITISRQGRIYVQAAGGRIWEFIADDEGRGKWQGRMLTFAGAGPDGKATDSLPGLFRLSALPDGRLAAYVNGAWAERYPSGLVILTPPRDDGKAAGADTKRD